MIGNPLAVKKRIDEALTRERSYSHAGCRSFYLRESIASVIGL